MVRPRAGAMAGGEIVMQRVAARLNAANWPEGRTARAVVNVPCDR